MLERLIKLKEILRKISFIKNRVIYKRIILLISIGFLILCFYFAVPVMINVSNSIKKQSLRMWKGIVCKPNAYLFGASEDFCRNKCAEKDVAAAWCGKDTYDTGVSDDGRIVYVAEGGCVVAAMSCGSSVECQEEALTCLAECSSDPHRVVTEKGCDCEGNWAPIQDKCECKMPFVLRSGECIPLAEKECLYDQEGATTYFACIEPSRTAEIYWEGQMVYGCTGSCYTSACTAKENIQVNDFWYSRGNFKEKLSLPKGRLEAAFSNIGGIYETCRVRM